MCNDTLSVSLTSYVCLYFCMSGCVFGAYKVFFYTKSSRETEGFLPFHPNVLRGAVQTWLQSSGLATDVHSLAKWGEEGFEDLFSHLLHASQCASSSSNRLRASLLMPTLQNGLENIWVT
ncbi:hypothetical protein GJAV_G00149750 [Gymnothorax javanicus]|nr:hypothetical protein GJAV_G00149750 [Gymnothorax javanicus]